MSEFNFTQVESRFGGLDILVSNAAVNPGFGPILDVSGNQTRNVLMQLPFPKPCRIIKPNCLEILQITEKIWDKIFDVNVKSAFFLCKDAIPLMEKRG